MLGKAFGQPEVPPAFEVASVKPSVIVPLHTATGTVLPKATSNPGRVDYPFVTLKTLIMMAYNVKNYQVLGPEWLGKLRYDVVATLPPSTRREQVPLMLQTLLTQRFRLTFHRESRNLSRYEMVVAAGGFKLKTEDPDTAERLMVAPIGGTKAKLIGKASLATLADRLSNFLGRPVVDMTGLEGIFAINLDFEVDATGAGAPPSVSASGGSVDGATPIVPNTATDPAPSLSAAFQHELGLRLEPRKGPMGVMIIEQAEKIPVEN
jgi:uncharacterized protein (TIGR03435 family)